LDFASQVLIEGRSWNKEPKINLYRVGASAAIGAVMPTGLGAAKDAAGAMRAASACRGAIMDALASIGTGFMSRNRVVNEMWARKLIERAMERGYREKLAKYAANELSIKAVKELLKKLAAMGAAKEGADALFGPEDSTRPQQAPDCQGVPAAPPVPFDARHFRPVEGLSYVDEPFSDHRGNFIWRMWHRGEKRIRVDWFEIMPDGRHVPVYEGLNGEIIRLIMPPE